MITSKLCKHCGKKAVVDSEFTIAGLLYQNFQCGHTQLYTKLTSKSFSEFKSLDNKRPFPFQIEGATWAINSNGRFLIMDEMGLGKTIQFLMVANSLKDTKFLLCCKSSLKVQWAKETYRWCNGALCQVVDSEQDFILPGCKGYIVSYDLLWRFKDIEAWIKKLGVNLIGLDEVQHLKNTDSKRTNGVRKACRQVDYIGALSGTPIKNHAGEFFPILNILHPEKFPSQMSFDMKWIDSYWDGHKIKKGGIRDWTRFHEYTKDFIIRRTRKEVMPELPVITRDYRFSELGEQVDKAYQAVMKEFKDYYCYGGMEDSSAQRTANILSFLTKMRHLAGIAKITPVVDFTVDFLEETDRKIVVFVHHKDVAFSVLTQLKAFTDPLSLTSDLDSDARNTVVEKFWSSNHRVLVASTLASGEGLNLQCCSDCIMMERQWNPANEEQAEGRFIRIGQQADKVSAMYPIAVGTVDEFFAEVVEKKRSICANTLDGEKYAWNESSLITELAEVIAEKGGRKWGF